MLGQFKQLVKKLLFILFNKHYYNNTTSFAQAGEDKVLEFLFSSMGISTITYLEIGTNNPIAYNNTYLFYLKGSRGVCVEPNPNLIEQIKKYRPNDVCLNVGVAKENIEELDFYIFDHNDSAKGLSTFSKDEVTLVESTTSIKLEKIIKIPVININKILEEYFATKAPDFVSIDVEGLDLEILQSFNFDLFRPIVFCVETVNFTTNHKKTKRLDIIDFMQSKDYFVYADTGINSIFADKKLF